MVSRQSLMRQKCSQHLDKDLEKNILFSQLVSENPFLGLLVTKDDQVYALGADWSNYFGLGPVTEIPQLTKIDSLCGKKICQFAAYGASYGHILTLSENGLVYAWGCNSHGQLGNYTKTDSTVPIVVAGDLEDKVVKQVQCGYVFSAALTENGQVFTWGCNGHGRTGHGINSGCTWTPKLVGGLLTDQVITKIFCQAHSLLCLNDEGQVFSFGSNGCGNLGIGNTANFSPVSVLSKIPIGHKIVDISSGKEHTLAETDNGILLAWGKNDHGQIGVGNTDNVTLPTRIKLFDQENALEVIKIVAEGDTSFAMDSQGTVYALGSVNGRNVLRPTVSEIEFPAPENESRSPSASKCCHSIVVNDLLESFDNKDTCDFVITVEGKDIHVHNSILRIRSPYFKTMFNNDWKETENGKIVIDHHSYDLYRQFLRYIYCGEVGELRPEQNMRLLDLATMVLDERLAELCTKSIKKQLKVENLLEVFSLALTLEKVDLVDHCVKWAIGKGMKKVVASQGFKEIPPEHVREFCLKYMEYGGFD